MPTQRERNAIPSPLRIAAPGYVRFAIKLAWDGTDYRGFQAQDHKNTIQDQIEFRLQRFIGGQRHLRIFGWGRTDGGVHAKGAVVTVDLSDEEVKTIAMQRNENSGLEQKLLAAKSICSALRRFSCDGGDGSITALSVVPVPSTFDPKFSSLWKRYVYCISCGSETRSPFVGRYAWQIGDCLDIERMIEAATLLSGRHNFSWLSVDETGEQRDPVRDLQLNVEQVVDPGHIHIIGNPGMLIKISGTCDAFLYRMMRRIVGALVAVGMGRSNIDQLKACIHMFDDGSSSTNGTSKLVPQELKETAPARGLCLDHIEYQIPV